MKSNRVELWGVLTEKPQLRIMPNGRPVLRMTVECGSEGERLALEVIMVDASSRSLASSLKERGVVHVTGRLRPISLAGRLGPGSLNLQVVASQIEAPAAGNPGREFERKNARGSSQVRTRNRNGGD